MDLILASLDNVSWSTGLIQLIYCLLHTILLCLWDLQYKPWKSALNGLKCDIPSHVLQRLMRLKQWFERFVNQWCLINVQEMLFAHWSIIWAKFGPSYCISKLRFQILTSPVIKLICWLWFSSFWLDIHFQKTEYLSPVRHKNKHRKWLFRFRENWYWMYM